MEKRMSKRKTRTVARRMPTSPRLVPTRPLPAPTIPRAEYICRVDAAQAETNGNPPISLIGVALTDLGGTFARTVFMAPDEVKREMLAIALAAISTQSQVLAVLDDPASVTRQCLLLQIDAA
jgi:hypothetical protein